MFVIQTALDSQADYLLSLLLAFYLDILRSLSTNTSIYMKFTIVAYWTGVVCRERAAHLFPPGKDHWY